MFSLISTVGLVLLLGLIAFLFIRDRITEPVAPDQDGRGGKPGSLSILVAVKKYYFWLMGIAIFMSLTSWLFFYSYAGYQYFLVYPNGTKSAVTTEGIKFAPFASVQEWNKNIDIKTVAKNPEHATDFNSEEGISELEGIMNPIDLRFIDQVTGTMNVTSSLSSTGILPTWFTTRLSLRFQNRPRTPVLCFLPRITFQGRHKVSSKLLRSNSKTAHTSY
jgi:hypothetical protein